MKITCILASYNRPNWVRQALKSVAQQTYRDFELLVYDDSSIFNINAAVAEFKFPSVKVHHENLTPKRRGSENRLSMHCNRGLKAASGDLICYLCDDDYYYPGWFEAAAGFFEKNPTVQAGFGRLRYSGSKDMVYPPDAHMRFPCHVVVRPNCVLDHNQVMHRRFTPPFVWPEAVSARGAPDGIYFDTLVKNGHPFHPVHADAVIKRMHKKNLQQTQGEIGTAAGESSREG